MFIYQLENAGLIKRRYSIQYLESYRDWKAWVESKRFQQDYVWDFNWEVASDTYNDALKTFLLRPYLNVCCIGNTPKRPQNRALKERECPKKREKLSSILGIKGTWWWLAISLSRLALYHDPADSNRTMLRNNWPGSEYLIISFILPFIQAIIPIMSAFLTYYDSDTMLLLTIVVGLLGNSLKSELSP